MIAILLQTNPSNPIQGINDLVDGATKLSHTANEVGVYNMITGVFMIIVLLFVLMQVFTFYKITNKLSIIAECSARTMVYFTDKLQKDINIDQARAIISEQIDKAASATKFQILLMKEANHISDTEATHERIRIFVENLYGKRVNHFKKFEYHEKNLAKILVPNRLSEAIELITELLYMDRDNFRIDYINRRIDEFYTTVKSDYNDRLDSL